MMSGTTLTYLPTTGLNFSGQRVIITGIATKKWFFKKQKDDITKLQSEATFCG